LVEFRRQSGFSYPDNRRIPIEISTIAGFYDWPLPDQSIPTWRDPMITLLPASNRLCRSLSPLRHVLNVSGLIKDLNEASFLNRAVNCDKRVNVCQWKPFLPPPDSRRWRFPILWMSLRLIPFARCWQAARLCARRPNGCGSCGRLDFEHQKTAEIVYEYGLSQRAKSPSVDAMAFFQTDVVARVLPRDGGEPNKDGTEKGEILVTLR
jgi:hypothetical protein